MNRKSVLVVLVLAALACGGSASGWYVEELDAGGVGAHSSLRVGPDDQVHIAYMANSFGYLKYARYDGSAWSTETADPTPVCGQFTSMAVDSHGQPQIAYLYYSGSCVRYARRIGSQWVHEDIDLEPDMEYDISLALDAADHPHISYWDGTFYGQANNLKYAHFNGVNWTAVDVDTPGQVGRGNSIAVDSQGRPVISYYDETNTAVKVARWDGNQWNLTVVDDIDYINFNFRTAIAIDSGDRVHLVYSAYENRLQAWFGQLKYALCDETGWHVEVIDEYLEIRDFRVPAITIDADNQPRVSYVYFYSQEPYSPDLKYAYRSAGGWQTEFVDQGSIADSDYSNGIDLDSSGVPHISYCENGITLKHARGESPAAAGDPPAGGGVPGGRLIPLRVSPNPVRTGCLVSFDLAEPTAASLDLYDAKGRWVAAAARGTYAAGAHSIAVAAPSRPGVYFVRLRAGAGRGTGRLIVTR